LAEAVAFAGGGEAGRALVSRLAGDRVLDPGKTEGPVQLITITDEGRWVNLIHETLIRTKGLDAAGKPQPYWPTLWQYIEQHKERAVWRERLQADMQTWLDKGKGPGFQWSHERVRELYAIMRRRGPKFELNALEREFLGPFDPDAMLAELKKPETTHKRRLLIGERLDILGDPRPGVGVVDKAGTPEIDWRPVPAGEVTISNLSDPNKWYSGLEDTMPNRVEAFDVARYPITVAQYRAFILAKDGWRDRGWWADLYRHADGDTYEFGQFGNHPAVYVNWFDAVAFCRWLSRRLGFTVRLPNEWEWQQAATGGDVNNVFPWGPEWDVTEEPWRANTFESRLEQATAVGMYPAGVAPTGVMDLAGRSGNGAYPIHPRPTTYDPTSALAILPCCAAGPGTARCASRARPSAPGADRPAGVTTSVSVWCVRPRLWAVISKSAAQAAPSGRVIESPCKAGAAIQKSSKPTGCPSWIATSLRSSQWPNLDWRCFCSGRF
jgi:hypothetical protein